MTTRMVRDTRALLSALDPAAGRPSTADGRDAELERILAVPREPRSRSVTRGRITLATIAVTVAAVLAVVGADAIRRDPPASQAALPPPLDYQPPGPSVDAASLLREIADAAQRSTTPGSGEYEYVKTKMWYLLHPEFTNRGFWSIEQVESQMWLRPTDASGRVREYRVDEPVSDQIQGPGEIPILYPNCAWRPEPVPPGFKKCPPDLPTDAAGVRRLFGGYRIESRAGVFSLLGIIADAATTRVLPPGTRAQLWRMLADQPGITYTGRVQDRGGRWGEAFSLDIEAGPGPARDTLILDPATGEPLGFERTLLRLTDPNFMIGSDSDMAPLEVSTPSVIQYVVFLGSELRPTTAE